MLSCCKAPERFRRPSIDSYDCVTYCASCQGTGATPTPSAETTETQDAQEKQAKELLDRMRDASQLNSSQVKRSPEELERNVGMECFIWNI